MIKDYTIYQASCLDVMDSLEENSIDCIVTDPPYEIGFMNKGWDNTGIAFNIDTWKKALRVLKPGGYLLAFNHSRTFHRMMIAIEDAGFELRDTIMWLYGSGFPKSHNISKAIDKRLGCEREVVGKAFRIPSNTKNAVTSSDVKGGFAFGVKSGGEIDITIPATDQAKQWDGYGTALKPAFEPIVMARKPFNTSVAENVLKYGVGGLNIDGCRVEGEPIQVNVSFKKEIQSEGWGTKRANTELQNQGRFPANVIHDGSDEVVSGFPETEPSQESYRGLQGSPFMGIDGSLPKEGTNTLRGHNDNGGSASRYFYCAKASKKDRDEGLLSKYLTVNDGRNKSIDNPFQRGETPKRNIHPTVKPTDLMQYLVRLVAPPNATILDPFMGSGSTGKACMIENNERGSGYHFIGVDLEEEYCEIAKARIEYGVNYKENKAREEEKNIVDDNQISIFDLGDE